MHQARLGLELRTGDEGQYRIRGGGGMPTSPFAGDAVVADANRFHVSVGGGMRVANVHFSRMAYRGIRSYYFMGAFQPTLRSIEPSGEHPDAFGRVAAVIRQCSA